MRVCVCVRDPRMHVCVLFTSPTMHLFHVSHLFTLPLPSSFIQSLRKSYRNCTTSCSSGLPQNATEWSFSKFDSTTIQSCYFGEKLHIDQNEKLVMFGVTPHLCYSWLLWENCSICQHASEKPCTDISTLVQVNSCTNWKLYISLFLHHKTIQTNTCGVWFI